MSLVVGPLPAGAGLPVLVVGTHSIHVRRFVAGLCAAGQPVVLVTDSAAPLVDDPLVLQQLQVNFAMRHLGTAGTIAAAIRRWQPQVVHAHQANSVAWHAARGTASSGVPLVLTLWGSDVLTLPHKSFLHHWMVRSSLRRAAAWTADARTVLRAADVVAGPGVDPLREWVPMGIDCLAAPVQPVRREQRILSCRLHKPLYRIDSILRAFALLPPALDGWVLEVAAGGEETPALQSLAASLNLGQRVEFTGMLSPAALQTAYCRSALFVSVPVSDGTSVSLLESLALGCLPVLSDLPANREWVRESDNGLLVADPTQPKQLASALQRAIEWWGSGKWDREARPANAALIEQHGLFRNNIRQFLNLYERLPSPAP